MNCQYCHAVLPPKHKTYCSATCHAKHTRQTKLEQWKRKEIVGYKGVAMVIKDFVRDYLLEKYSNKCVKCGWGERHPLSKRPCLEIDHIDGDASNSYEDNLTVLCPNCHSLTPNHRGFNKTKEKRFRKYGAPGRA